MSEPGSGAEPGADLGGSGAGSARAAMGRISTTAGVLVVLASVGVLSTGGRISSVLALTGAALLGIFAFGSFRPLVERLYSPETQRLHLLPAWLLVVHTAVFGGAVLVLFRWVRSEHGALLMGLVVVPIAIAVEAFIQILRPRNTDARRGSP